MNEIFFRPSIAGILYAVAVYLQATGIVKRSSRASALVWPLKLAALSLLFAGVHFKVVTVGIGFLEFSLSFVVCLGTLLLARRRRLR